MKSKETLTADFGRGEEGVGHGCIHSDHVALLLGDRLVPLRDHALDPVEEGLLDDCGDHVADPLLGHLLDLLRVGEVIVDVLVALVEVFADVLEREALVLRDRDVADVLAQDHCDGDRYVRMK